MAKDTEKLYSLTREELMEMVSTLAEQKVSAIKESDVHEKSEKEKAEDAWWNELVPLRLFRDGRDYKDDVYVCLNDYRALIKRGVEVRVPRRVAKLIEESLDQSNIASDRIREVVDNLAGM